MITKKDIEFASSMGWSLSTLSKELDVVPDTLMSALTSNINFKEIADGKSLLEESIRVVGSGETLADRVTDSAGTIRRVIGNIMNVAKNEATPLCRDIYEKINTRVDEMMDAELLNLGKVNVVDMNGPAGNSILNSMVDKLSRPVKIDRGLRIELLSELRSALADQDVMEICEGVHPDLTEAMTQYIKDQTGNMDAYSYIDVINPLLKYNGDDTPTSFICDFVSFVFLTGVLASGHEKTLFITQDTASNTEIQRLRSEVGVRIRTDIDILAKGIETGRMIYNGRINKSLAHMGGYVPTHIRNNIYVIGKTYRDWVKNKGGSPEALIGYHLSTKESNGRGFINRLIEDPDAYKKIYDSKIRVIKATNDLKKGKLIRDSAADIMTDKINSMDLESSEKAELHRNLKRALEKNMRGANDVVPYIRDIVCETMQYPEEVSYFLYSLNKELSDEDTTFNTALVVAAASVTARWIKRQLIVTPKRV